MRKIIAVFILVLAVFGSCRRDPYQVNVSGNEVDIEIKRFEKDLFAVDPSETGQALPYLQGEYGRFFELFNRNIIGIGSPGSIAYPDYLKRFLTDYLNNEVYRAVVEKFDDLGQIEDDFSGVFSHYRYYFPDREIPEVISFVSRFNRGIVVARGILAVGLDMYLGRDSKYYEMLGYYQYQRERMHPGRIVPDCMYSWGVTEFEYNDSIDNLLSNMIYQGKMMYFTKSMMPSAPDSVIMGFTPAETEWCRTFEKHAWTHLVERKLLFETSPMTITRFIKDGPFTRDFGQNSPARAAVWIGWRIVESYALGRKVPLDELMCEDDYQKILNRSAYDP